MNAATHDSAPCAGTLRELMTQYKAKRAEWIARFGNAYGFDAWFTKQVMGQ